MKGPYHLRWIAGAALVIGAALCGIVFGPRLLSEPGYDQNDQLAMSRPDARTIWRYRPGVTLSYTSPEFTMQIRTNADGLRSGPVAGPDDAPAVLFIGDAFTFGWGVAEEQRFSDLIGRQLGRPVRIVNAGHWMYSFDQQLVLAKELIARYRPKVVVQDFYWMYVRILHGHTYKRASDGSLQAVLDPGVDVDSRGVVRFRSDKMAGAGDWMSYLRPGPQNADLWQRTEDLIDETISTVQAAGTAYVPFLTPAGIELPGGNWATVGWTAPQPPTDVDVTLPAARLAGLFAKRGVQIVSLLPSMRDKGAGLYYPQDGHWTPAAHALAAATLTPNVSKALEGRP